MANLTGGEREEIAAMVRREFEIISKRIENEHLRMVAIINSSLDKIQDAAQLVQTTQQELDRVLNLVEGFEVRLQEIEAEFGW